MPVNCRRWYAAPAPQTRLTPRPHPQAVGTDATEAEAREGWLPWARDVRRACCRRSDARQKRAADHARPPAGRATAGAAPQSAAVGLRSTVAPRAEQSIPRAAREVEVRTRVCAPSVAVHIECPGHGRTRASTHTGAGAGIQRCSRAACELLQRRAALAPTHTELLAGLLEVTAGPLGARAGPLGPFQHAGTRSGPARPTLCLPPYSLSLPCRCPLCRACSRLSASARPSQS